MDRYWLVAVTLISLEDWIIYALKGVEKLLKRREVEKGQCHLPGFEPGPSVYRTDVLSTTPQVPRQESNSNVES